MPSLAGAGAGAGAWPGRVARAEDGVEESVGVEATVGGEESVGAEDVIGADDVGRAAEVVRVLDTAIAARTTTVQMSQFHPACRVGWVCRKRRARDARRGGGDDGTLQPP
jgi:hypothetical protein